MPGSCLLPTWLFYSQNRKDEVLTMIEFEIRYIDDGLPQAPSTVAARFRATDVEVVITQVAQLAPHRLGTRSRQMSTIIPIRTGIGCIGERQ
jgi:hypothetical protein